MLSMFTYKPHSRTVLTHQPHTVTRTYIGHKGNQNLLRYRLTEETDIGFYSLISPQCAFLQIKYVDHEIPPVLTKPYRLQSISIVCGYTYTGHTDA